MHITLSPIRSDETLTLHRAGDVLTINGTALDFGPLPEGAVLPRSAAGCAEICSDVTRIDGEIHLTLALPHGPVPSPAPPGAQAVLFPAPVHVTEDGPVALPAYAPEEESEA